MDLLNFLGSFGRASRLLRFLLAGGTALAVNLAVLFLLVDILHVWYIFGTVIAFTCAFIVSFGLQKFWTFNNHLLDTLHIQLSISLVVALGNMFLNTALMYILVDYFSVYHILAQIIASALIACESFFMYKHVVFTHRTNLDTRSSLKKGL